MLVCSCDSGYEGSHCQTVAGIPPELPLLVGLGTLLPVAAIMVGVVTSVLIYRRLKARKNLPDSRQHRDNVRRAKYVASTCLDTYVYTANDKSIAFSIALAKTLWEIRGNGRDFALFHRNLDSLGPITSQRLKLHP